MCRTGRNSLTYTILRSADRDKAGLIRKIAKNRNKIWAYCRNCGFPVFFSHHRLTQFLNCVTIWLHYHFGEKSP